MEQKFTCRHCKREKQEEPRTLLKEEKSGWKVLFSPLCEACLKEISSKPLEELFPWDKFKRMVS